MDDTPTPRWKSVLLAMEARSEHPLAEAVAASLSEEGVRPAKLSDFTSLTGRGVQGTGEDGTTYYAGNHKLLKKHSITCDEQLAQKADQLL